MSQPTYPQSTPKRGHMMRNLSVGCLGLLLLLVAVVVVVAVASGGDETADTLPGVDVSPSSEAEGDGDPLTSAEPSPTPEPNLGEPGESDDVTITSCAAGDFGSWVAGLTVVNSADDTSSYLITVAVLAADGSRVGTLNAAVDSLSAGQSGVFEAFGTVVEGQVGVRCELADMDRFSTP